MASWDVSIEQSVDGVSVFNTIQMDDDAQGGGPFASVAERVWEAWRDNLLGVQMAGVQLLGVVARSRDGSVVQEFDQVQNSANTDAPVPINCGALITKVSGGLSRNGRWFLAGINETAVDGKGLIAPNTRNLITTSCEGFRTQLAASELVCTIDRMEPNGFGSIITSFNCKQYIGRQSRRLNRARS